MRLLKALLPPVCFHVLAVVGVAVFELWQLTRANLKFAAADADPSSTMRAAQFSSFGDASVVRLAHIQRPRCCGPSQVMVRVTAGALNPVDFKQRRMEAPAMMRPLPSVSGFDFSGIVEEVGEGVAAFKRSDAVYGMLPLLGQRWGAFQEYVVADASIIAHAPRSVPTRDAAALPLVGLTVLQALRPVLDRWRAEGASASGKQILIQAGAGGVGSFAIQYCKNVLGMRVATTASARNRAFVEDLGASLVVDYRQERFEDVVAAQDVVLDTVTHEYEARTMASPVLKGGGQGHYVNVLSSDWQPNSREGSPLFVVLPLLKKWAFGLPARLGLGVNYHCNPVSPDGAGLGEIAGWVDSGLIKPVIDRSFSLEDTSKAHEYLEGGRARGKVLIDVGVGQ